MCVYVCICSCERTDTILSTIQFRFNSIFMRSRAFLLAPTRALQNVGFSSGNDENLDGISREFLPVPRLLPYVTFHILVKRLEESLRDPENTQILSTPLHRDWNLCSAGYSQNHDAPIKKFSGDKRNGFAVYKFDPYITQS